MSDSGDVRDLEGQVERGNLFAHTVLTEQAMRANENEAIVNGLVDLLIRGGTIESEELLRAVQSARKETADAGQLASVGIAIRIDGEEEAGEALVAVDCDERLPICKAVCCRLRFALSVEEVESGPLRWDLGRPYLNRHGDDGYCHRIDGETRGCSIYEDRPSVCRRYSCARDGRIWKDFEAMELNDAWIDANLGADRPTPIEIYMNA